MKAFISLLLLISMASGGLPSDEIQHVVAPSIISLEHVNASVPKLFASQNVNLSTYLDREMPNMGHYCTWEPVIVQHAPDLTDSQQNILENNSSEMVYL